MGDAAEVLSALYERLATVAAQAGQPTLLDDNFGLHVKVRPESYTHPTQFVRSLPAVLLARQTRCA